MAIQRHMTRCYIVKGPAPKKKVKKRATPAPVDDKPPAKKEPDPASTLNAYQRLQDLAQKSDDILAKAQKAKNDKLMLWAMAESRKNIEAMIKGFEAQKRIEALYSGKEDLSATEIYRFLKAYYPVVCEDLVRHLKEVRQG